MSREEVYKLLIDDCFHIELNTSDFFAYSCADWVKVSFEDLAWMIPIIEKYGSNGLSACKAYLRNKEPIEPYKTTLFLCAISELKELDPKVHSDDEYPDEVIYEGAYRTVIY